MVWVRNQKGSTCCSPVQLHILLIQFLELHLVFQLWHFRLGHPSHAKLSLLNKLVPDVHVNKSHCGDICHFSKQKRLSFPSSMNVSLSAFELIRVDLWGPFFVPTAKDFRFFLTIDDSQSIIGFIR